MDVTSRRSRIFEAPLRRSRITYIGPGLVSAAANNDPTTVATLAVIGATTGYALCWLVVLVVPMLAVVQALAAGVGVVCKTSLQGVIRRQFGLSWAVATLCAVAVVNVITLAADVKAGSEALALLTRVQAEYFIIPFVVGVGWLLVSQSYSRVERYLTLLPIFFVCFAGSAVLAHIDLPALVHGTFVPQFTLSPAYAYGALALLGTTLTSYVYMWESVEVAERRSPNTAVRGFRRDAVWGMLAVGVVFFFVLVASAATLGAHRLPISTAEDMAAALGPIAGPWAGTLFGVGLLGSALLAVPVLAGTTAYVAAHTFGWDGSLDGSWHTSKRFYGVLIASLAIAAIAAFARVSPVALLYWASIAGGLATPLTLIFLTLVAGNRTLMGPYCMSRSLTAVAWVITGAVVVAGVVFLTLSPAHPT